MFPQLVCYLGEGREGHILSRRLSNRSINVYAAMPKGIMGSGSSRCFSAMTGEGMNICLHVVNENNESRFDTYFLKGIY